MLARDLAKPYPTVSMDTDGLTAALLLTEDNQPGLIVVDDRNRPVAVVPGSQVLRSAVPQYVLDDPTLARVVEESAADAICAKLAQRSVASLVEALPAGRSELPVANADDTVLEVAAMMAGARSPLVAVRDGSDRDAPLLGAVSLRDLLDVLLPAASTSAPTGEE